MPENSHNSRSVSPQRRPEVQREQHKTTIDSLLQVARLSVGVPTAIIAVEEPCGKFAIWQTGLPEGWEPSEAQRFFCSISSLLSANEDHPVTISDIQADPAAAGIREAQNMPMASVAATSLPHLPQAVSGLLCVCDTDTRAWPDEAVESLDYIAALAVSVIKEQSVSFDNEDAVGKGAIAQLHEHDHRYRSLFEYNLNAVFSLDSCGYFREANRACESLSGYTVAQLREMTFWQFIAPEDREHASSLFQSTLNGSPTDWRLTMICRSGDRIDVRGNSIPIVIDGETAGIFGVIHDTTEQNLAETTLQQKEVLLRAQAEASNQGIIIVSAEGRILSYNRRFRELWGIPQHIMETGSILEARTAVLEQLADPEQFVSDVRFLYDHPDETRRDEIQLSDGRIFSRYTVPVRDEHGNHYGRGWYYRDMTEQRRIEQGLREEAQRLSSLVTHNPEIVVELDRRGTILSANPACKTTLGYDPEELLGRPFSDFACPEDAQFIWDQLEQVAGGQKCEFELTARQKAGHLVDLTIQFIPITLDQQVIGFWAVGEDLTEMKQMGQRLQKSEAHLLKAQQIAHIGSWEWDIPTGTLHWSPETYRIFGVEPNGVEPTFDLFLNAVPSEDRTSVKEALSRTLNNDEPYGIDIRILRPDGTERWVHAQGEVTIHLDDSPVQMAGTVMDITERKVLETELAYHAFNDPLTGIANRRLFMDRLNHALARAHRHSFSLGMLFIDLDDFKSVNDSLGHANADRLLVMVAERLRKCARDTDTVARFGGDEFVILLEGDPHEEHAIQVAERVLERIRVPFTVLGVTVSVTPSIGVVPHVLPETDPDALLRAADLAMYRAKQRGKARYEIFDAEMQQETSNSLALVTELRSAIEEDRLSLQFQPKIRIDSGAAVAAEPLLRWDHPELGPVSPTTFIPVAERAGLIVSIGRWALRAACRQSRMWQVHLPDDTPIIMCVNLSAIQLREDDLVTTVISALRDNQLHPSSLCLEITETTLVGEGEGALDTLRELKALGVRLAIDDFGTGHSSLSYLKSLPVDWIKVDRSFIDDLGNTPANTAILRAIIDLAHALGLQVVAEGIETQEQLRYVTELGCDIAQGYFIARPTSGDEALRWLMEHVQ